MKILHIIIFISVFTVLILITPDSQATTCTANTNVSTNCDDLSLDGAGAVTIDAGATVSSIGGVAVINSSSSNSLINYGVIRGNSGDGMHNDASLAFLINSGTINSSGQGGQYGVLNSSSITTLYNSGSISGLNGGLYNANGSSITNLTNATNGSIGSGGPGIYNQGTIGVLMNIGTIISVFSTRLYNGGVINTLNNLNSSIPLTYSGNLPTNYNIIINSSTSYGQLSGTSVNGTTSFGIYADSLITSRLYTGVLQGLASSNIVGSGSTRTGTFDGMTWTLTETVSSAGSENWDLSFTGVSIAKTQSSLQFLASKLRGTFSSQAIATNFANMNTYDCNLFDARGLCISVGGQQTYVDNPSSNLTSTVVVAGYKVSPTLRIGGFLNQNINNHTSANVDISNANPLMGLFSVWNQNEDHLGYQVKVANAYQDKDVTTTRDVVGTSEAGRGSTELNTQSYVGELSYAFLANEDKTLVRPYAAIRYTRIKQDGYTEQASGSVTAPLTYSALSDRSTAVLVGVKLNHKLTDKVNLAGSLGIEQDIYHHVDNLTAIGVSGLTSENFNDNIKRTRPVASIGAYFSPAKNQRIAADFYYQQLPFQSTGSTTAYVNYTIGF